MTVGPDTADAPSQFAAADVRNTLTVFPTGVSLVIALPGSGTGGTGAALVAGDPIAIQITTNSGNHVFTAPAGWSIVSQGFLGTGSRCLLTRNGNYQAGDVSVTVPVSPTVSYCTVNVGVLKGSLYSGFGTVGAVTTRGSSATTTLAKAAGTPPQHVMVLSHEKTTNQTSCTVAPATDTILNTMPNSGQAGSAFMGIYDSTGGTADRTMTYALTGNTNGAAYQLPLISGAATIPPTPRVTLWDGSKETPITAQYYDGTNVTSMLSVLPYPGDQTVNTLLATPNFHTSHRGGSNNWPEMTLYAYEQSAMLMMRSMEISVWRSADGVFVCSHDQNTSRVTGTSMDIPTSNWSAISALMVNPVGTDNQAQPARPICRIEEVLSHFGLTHVLFVEDKSGSNGSALLDILDAYGGATHHIWKMYGVSVNNVQRAQAQARGYKTWGYYFLADNANIASTAASWDLIGLDFNMSDAQITAAVGLGRPAVGHIIANTTQRDRMLSLGCIGVVDAAPKTVFPW